MSLYNILVLPYKLNYWNKWTVVRYSNFDLSFTCIIGIQYIGNLNKKKVQMKKNFKNES